MPNFPMLANEVFEFQVCPISETLPLPTLSGFQCQAVKLRDKEAPVCDLCV